MDLEFQSNQKVDLIDDEAVKNMLDDIWETYDLEKNGSLNKEETKKLCQDTFGVTESGEEITDELFDEMFLSIDKNKNGKVEREELFTYMKYFLNKN